LASTTVLALQSIPGDSRVGGAESAKYPAYSNYHSSTRNEHDVRFHLPGRQNGSIKILYFNGPASIVMYLSLKGLNAGEIHYDLVATLNGEAKSYSTVTYYLRKPSFSSPKTARPSESPAPIFNESNEAILLALFEEPSRRCGSFRAEPTYTFPRSATTPRTSLGSPFDIFVGPHIFCRRLTSTPEHNFHLNSSRCSSPRKTGRGMIL
jgi:hypothetical protein